jgi:hypothetical protein
MEALVSDGRSLQEPSARNQAGKGIGIMGEVQCRKFGTSKRVVSQASRAVKKMLLCVVSLSRGFTEPCNYSSFELIFSV